VGGPVARVALREVGLLAADVAPVRRRGGIGRSPAPLSASTSSEGDFDGTVGQVLREPRIVLTPIQRADLRGGLIDPRVVSILATVAAQHTIVITALRSDPSTKTVDGNLSNHAAGRAFDIGAVDGERCRGTRTGRCADLVCELAAMHGTLRSTELIYCWDPDVPADARGFARADHCDHIHVGWDG
jgi:hypothetical protein